MKTRTSIAAVAAAGLLGASAVVVPAALASSQTVTHTLRFKSIELTSISFSSTHFGQSDVDRNRAHERIGFDTLNGVFDPQTHSVKFDVSLDIKGGFMYFHLHSTSSTTFAGTITGGTGKFSHSAGTIVARNLNQAGTRTAVTVTYHG
jgi:hypothetical protein